MLVQQGDPKMIRLKADRTRTEVPFTKECTSSQVAHVLLAG